MFWELNSVIPLNDTTEEQSKRGDAEQIRNY